MPYRRLASILEVESKPAMYAARAEVTADCSLVRRDPISMIGRPSAAVTMRDAAVATAESEFRIDRITVSRMQHSANVPRTVRMGE